MVSCPLKIKEGRTLEQELNILLSKGYTRVLVDNQPAFIEDLLEEGKLPKGKEKVAILIDRSVVKPNDEDTQYRLGDSVQTAYFEGEGDCTIHTAEGNLQNFSDRFELDGMRFEQPTVNFFSFNNPFGACRTCEGFGKILGIDPDLVIPDKSLSTYEGAIAPFRGETMKKWLEPLLKKGVEYDFPIHRPINELEKEHTDMLWNGIGPYKGLHAFFKYLESKTHKIQYRVMLSRYRGRTTCPDCRGTRLRKDASYVKINNKSITDLVLLPIEQVIAFFDGLELTEHDRQLA